MKRILVAPLDWGLGHAARCIPLIRYLLERNCKVIIGADGRPFDLLKKEFPSCEFVRMSGYHIMYPENGSMALKMASQIPKILAGIKREHNELKKIVSAKKIDAVISDNRFGLWTKGVPCVFITHQLMVKSPFGEKFIHELNKKYISKYNECWVPDVQEKNNLSGDLSHKYPLPPNSKFIGILSRFVKPVGKPELKRKLLVILSGPELQRTVFEKIILRQISSVSGSALIVQGITEKNDRSRISNEVEIVSHLASHELEREILSSEIILSRPGYSTVMDLATLKKKAIFVPTPGQTEQEYLAGYYLKHKIVYSAPQKNFDLESALKESGNYSGFKQDFTGTDFKKAVDEFLKL